MELLYRTQKCFILAALIFNLAAGLITLQAADIVPGMAEGAEPSKLCSRPEIAGVEIERFEEDGSPCIFASTDAHAVFDVEMNALIELLSDFDAGGDIYPRIDEMKNLSPEKGIYEDRLQGVNTSVRFLGIGQDFAYTCLVSARRNGSTDYYQHWRMLSNEAGNLDGYEGFFYLKNLGLEADGKPRTYIRLYAESTFRGLIPLQELIIRIFTESETKATLRSVYLAAKK